MSFSKLIDNYNWDKIKSEIYSRTSVDVELALSEDKRTLSDFISLISPAAMQYIEQMAIMSNKLTQERFGKTIQLFIPLYLSNECQNQCLYCGFSNTNNFPRKTLTENEILKEVEIIKKYGYEHILLVTGDHPEKVGFEYIKNVIKLIKPYFSLLSIEVQPLEQSEYEELIAQGLHTVYIYQETYNEKHYPVYHPSGTKSNFEYRLDTPDRLGKAGIHRTGMGILIGLEDWRVDSVFTMLHLKYLQKNYWKTKYSVSFPRLRPHIGNFIPNFTISDKELVQLITAYRLIDNELELSVSVRESPKFRNNIIKLGVTSMSAGSKTLPGGYYHKYTELEQFEIHDNRSPSEFVEVIKSQGYEAVWKDWDSFF